MQKNNFLFCLLLGLSLGSSQNTLIAREELTFDLPTDHPTEPNLELLQEHQKPIRKIASAADDHAFNSWFERVSKPSAPEQVQGIHLEQRQDQPETESSVIPSKASRARSWMKNPTMSSFAKIFQSDRSLISDLIKESIDQKTQNPLQKKEIQQKISKFSRANQITLFNEITKYEADENPNLTQEQATDLFLKNKELFQEALPQDRILFSEKYPQSDDKIAFQFSMIDLSTYNPDQSIEQNVARLKNQQNLRLNNPELTALVRNYLETHPSKQNLQALLIDAVISKQPLLLENKAIQDQLNGLSRQDRQNLLTKITEKEISIAPKKLSTQQARSVFIKNAATFQLVVPKNEMIIPIEDETLTKRKSFQFEIIDVSSVEEQLATLDKNDPDYITLHNIAFTLKQDLSLKLRVTDITTNLKKYLKSLIVREAIEQEQPAPEKSIVQPEPVIDQTDETTKTESVPLIFEKPLQPAPKPILNIDQRVDQVVQRLITNDEFMNDIANYVSKNITSLDDPEQQTDLETKIQRAMLSDDNLYANNAEWNFVQSAKPQDKIINQIYKTITQELAEGKISLKPIASQPEPLVFEKPVEEPSTQTGYDSDTEEKTAEPVSQEPVSQEPVIQEPESTPLEQELSATSDQHQQMINSIVEKLISNPEFRNLMEEQGITFITDAVHDLRTLYSQDEQNFIKDNDSYQEVVQKLLTAVQTEFENGTLISKTHATTQPEKLSLDMPYEEEETPIAKEPELPPVAMTLKNTSAQTRQELIDASQDELYDLITTENPATDELTNFLTKSSVKELYQSFTNTWTDPSTEIIDATYKVMRANEIWNACDDELLRFIAKNVYDQMFKTNIEELQKEIENEYPRLEPKQTTATVPTENTAEPEQTQDQEEEPLTSQDEDQKYQDLWQTDEDEQDKQQEQDEQERTNNYIQQSGFTFFDNINLLKYKNIVSGLQNPTHEMIIQTLLEQEDADFKQLPEALQIKVVDALAKDTDITKILNKLALEYSDEIYEDKNIKLDQNYKVVTALDTFNNPFQFSNTIYPSKHMPSPASAYIEKLVNRTVPLINESMTDYNKRNWQESLRDYQNDPQSYENFIHNWIKEKFEENHIDNEISPELSKTLSELNEASMNTLLEKLNLKVDEGTSLFDKKQIILKTFKEKHIYDPSLLQRGFTGFKPTLELIYSKLPEVAKNVTIEEQTQLIISILQASDRIEPK